MAQDTGADRADQDAAPDSADDLLARVAQLEAENERLRAAGAAAGGGAGTRGRGFATGLLVAVAAFLLALSVPALWLNRMVTDTDAYVATVAPLAQDPDIQVAVANAASEALIERLDAAERLKRVLPEQLQLIATPIAQAVNGFIEDQSLSLVRSEQFAQTWEAVNRASHKALVAAVTGREAGALGLEAGVITLDVGVLAEQVRDRLTGAGLDLAAQLPTSAINKQVVLYRSPLLAQLATAFDTIARMAFWLPLLGLAFAAGAVALTSDRRKTILWLGVAIAVGAVLPLQALYLSQTVVASQLYQLAGVPTPAAQSAFEIVFRDLIAADRALAVFGIVLWVGALFAGPARWAVAVRSGLQGGLGGVARQLELGPVGAWVAPRKQGLRWSGAGVVLLVLLALPSPRTVASIVWLTVAFVVWLLTVELLGASGGEDERMEQPHG